MSKLIVIGAKDAQGQPTIAIKQSTTKPEWGSVLVMEESYSVTNGLLVANKRIAAYRAKMSTLNALDIKLGDDFNAKLAGLGVKPMKIFVKESLAKQYEGHTPKINPSTQAVITTDVGQPIYYNTVVDFVETGKDEFVSKSAVAVSANLETALH